jgi:hypothetical protein
MSYGRRIITTAVIGLAATAMAGCAAQAGEPASATGTAAATAESEVKVTTVPASAETTTDTGITEWRIALVGGDIVTRGVGAGGDVIQSTRVTYERDGGGAPTAATFTYEGAVSGVVRISSDNRVLERTLQTTGPASVLAHGEEDLGRHSPGLAPEMFNWGCLGGILATAGAALGAGAACATVVGCAAGGLVLGGTAAWAYGSC